MVRAPVHNREPRSAAMEYSCARGWIERPPGVDFVISRGLVRTLVCRTRKFHPARTLRCVSKRGVSNVCGVWRTVGAGVAGGGRPHHVSLGIWGRGRGGGI